MSTFNTDIKSLFDLAERFPTEDSCIEYLEKLFWGDELPQSPFDNTSKVYKCKNHKYKCKNTGKYFNVRTGTMYDSSNIKLRKWFMAVWLVTTHKKGIASLQLAKDINVTQATAWFMLQRIRAAYGIENCAQLDGIVEADEAMVGGKQKNRHKNKRLQGTGGRSTVDKDAVFGMAQRDGKIVVLAVKDCDASTLQPIIKKYVSKDSLLITDSWNGYNGMDSHCNHYMIKDQEHGYKHDYNPEIHTNCIEGAWKHMKASVSGMYNHVSRKHLQLYLDEFVYRHNMRKLPTSDQFNWLVANSNVRTKYKDLVNG